jgi:DNA-binding CsgD family transcriptional regulator
VEFVQVQHRNSPHDIGFIRSQPKSFEQVFDLLMAVMGASSAACLLGYRDNKFLGAMHQGKIRFETRFLTECDAPSAFPPRKVRAVETDGVLLSGDSLVVDRSKFRLVGDKTGNAKVFWFRIDDDTIDLLVLDARDEKGQLTLERSTDLLVTFWEKLRSAYFGGNAEQSNDQSLSIIQAVLDAIPAPTVLVRGDRSVVASNARASGELRSGNFIRQMNQFLTTSTRAETHLLHGAIHSVLADDGPATRMLLASDANSGQRTILEVRRLSLPQPATVTVEPLCLVTMLRRADVTSVARVAAAYGLTQSEQRLVAQLATGSNVRDAAEAVGIKESSARTYIKRVFMKMGVSRQAQLISLVSSQSVLLRNEGDEEGSGHRDES